MRVREPVNFPIVLKGLGELRPKLIIAGERGLRRGLEFTRTVVQREFLSGPRPGRLDVRTTRLRQSIAIDVKSSHRGVVGRIGSNVRYAAFHEFGFRGQQQVRSHTRALGTRRAARLQRGGSVGIQFVRGHTRRIEYEGRPFIRPALIKARPLILSEMKKELEGLKP